MQRTTPSKTSPLDTKYCLGTWGTSGNKGAKSARTRAPATRNVVTRGNTQEHVYCYGAQNAGSHVPTLQNVVQRCPQHEQAGARHRCTCSHARNTLVIKYSPLGGLPGSCWIAAATCYPKQYSPQILQTKSRTSACARVVTTSEAARNTWRMVECLGTKLQKVGKSTKARLPERSSDALELCNHPRQTSAIEVPHVGCALRGVHKNHHPGNGQKLRTVA